MIEEETTPPETAPTPEPPPAPTFQEWQERFEKCFQFRGLPIPEVEVPLLLAQYDEGRTPVEAFELINQAPES